ncbi:uncharacterized protein LOC123709135 [Pieris brassicae]|nr:uncharacterized protein LOC123709135 [Pieris brassicae]XP_045516233.1 uncharacterized protein LOC123709135 [Pieris brassicae]XP_045516234.1 uncharacterized protein LOC123709135 [Pieris brassicae]
MTDQNSKMPEPRKVGVWTEGPPLQTKELIIQKKSPESFDDIPTLPDIDDFQDILEKELSKPPVTERKDTETANTLAEVSGGITTSVEGIDAALDILKTYIPHDSDSPDTIWTIDSLLMELNEEIDDN